MSGLNTAPPPNAQLLVVFCDNYCALEGKVITMLRESAGDSLVITRVGDQLDEFLVAVKQVSSTLSTSLSSLKVSQHAHIFIDEERVVIKTNLAPLQLQICLGYRHTLDTSHHGRLSAIQLAETGRPGQPCMILDEAFLRFAYTHQGAALVSTICQALLDYGITEPGSDPFSLPPGPSDALSGVHPPAQDEHAHHSQNT